MTIRIGGKYLIRGTPGTNVVRVTGEPDRLGRYPVKEVGGFNREWAVSRRDFLEEIR